MNTLAAEKLRDLIAYLEGAGWIGATIEKLWDNPYEIDVTIRVRFRWTEEVKA